MMHIRLKFENGQTLIETIVAIGLLTTGIIGGLSLAIYAEGSSDVVLNQIVATNLAREGVEIVRNMRDTEWLEGAHTGGPQSCPDIGTDQECYPGWYSAFSGLPGQASYKLEFNPVTYQWSVQQTGGPNFQLYRHSSGIYTHVSSGGTLSNFSRVIWLDFDTSAPFVNDTDGAAIEVQSIVWWSGKRCPVITNVNLLNNTTCKVIVEDTLTNWRNY